MIPGIGRFTKQLRKEADTYFERFVNHPFQVEMRRGTLSAKPFGQYLMQDALYLIEDAKAFTAVAIRCEEEDNKASLFFRQMASDSYALEAEMQGHFFQLYQLTPALKPSEVCGAYTRFLMQHAHLSPLPVAFAALLPCFWLFQEAALEPWVAPNRYHAWLTTYSGEAYLAFTKQFIGIMEQAVSQNTPQAITEAAIAAFLTSANWECRFLDEACQSNPDRLRNGSIEGS